jgi:hypothetical protein
MATLYSPKIVTDGLVLSLDAANQKSFTSTELEVEYLIVAGGGGGAVHNTGGAGGGGVLLGKTTVIPQSYSVVVGSGGTWGNTNSLPTNGGNSSVFGNTAIGGGRGGQWTQFLPTDGGSGAGGNAFSATSSPSHTTGKIGLQPTSTDGGFGNNGGNALVGSSDRAGGGGGGSDTSGYNASSNVPGNGGDGILLNISGVGTHYGGGGGGAHRFNSSISVGGNGGGGMGLSSGASKDGSQFGQVNTGGGAGGIETGTQTGTGGGNGGSGIVIIRYRGPQKAKGGTVTQSNGWTIHTFTGSGNFEVGQFWGDISLNENSGELVNGPTFSSDNLGSLSFDGVNDYIETTQNNSFGTSPFTVNIWFKPNVSQVENSTLLCTSITQNNTNWQISFTNDLLRFFLQSNVWVDSTYTANAQWTNVNMVRASTETAGFKIYINGVLDVTSTVSNNFTDNTTYRLAMNRGSNAHFSGNISGVQIYNRALTADEVLQNYNATKGRYGL